MGEKVTNLAIYITVYRKVTPMEKNNNFMNCLSIDIHQKLLAGEQLARLRIYQELKNPFLTGNDGLTGRLYTVHHLPDKWLVNG